MTSHSAPSPPHPASLEDEKRLEAANEYIASEEAAVGAVLPFQKSKAERRLVLKQDCVIIPFCMLLYLMAFRTSHVASTLFPLTSSTVDRGNMGNAKLMNFVNEALDGQGACDPARLVCSQLTPPCADSNYAFASTILYMCVLAILRSLPH
jgi:hypothetical protein